MSEQAYWKTKWDERETKSVNRFAKKAFSFVRDLKKDWHGLTLLDLGCGDGKDSLYFARNGFHVTSVDFSESGIQRLRNAALKGGFTHVTAVQEDLRKIHFKENSFDVIYAHLSLHYFDDVTTTQLFDRLSTFLKEGGLIFVKCKSTDDSLYGVGEKVGKDMYIKNHLRHFFSKGYMVEKMRMFKILNVRKTSSVYHAYKSAFIEAIATKVENEKAFLEIKRKPLAREFFGLLIGWNKPTDRIKKEMKKGG